MRKLLFRLLKSPVHLLVAIAIVAIVVGMAFTTVVLMSDKSSIRAGPVEIEIDNSFGEKAE